MKKYLLTGLVIVLPVTLTLMIVLFLIDFLTHPLVGWVGNILDNNHILDYGFLFLSAEQVQRFLSQFIILIVLFFSISLLGYIGRWFLFHYFLNKWHTILHKIPFIGTVHKTAQDVIETLFSQDSKAFKQVAIVPFPSKELSSIGFISKNVLLHAHQEEITFTAVFVPTTPNPTSGFLMFYGEKDVKYVDMKVDDALSYIVSCGIIASSAAKGSS